MPITKISGSVTENLKRIKGQDKKINTVAEAKALLEYMSRADICCGEDYVRLYNAYQEAKKILSGTDANIGESLEKFFRKVMERGETFLANISDEISGWGKLLVSN